MRGMKMKSKAIYKFNKKIVLLSAITLLSCARLHAQTPAPQPPQPSQPFQLQLPGGMRLPIAMPQAGTVSVCRPYAADFDPNHSRTPAELHEEATRLTERNLAGQLSSLPALPLVPRLDNEGMAALVLMGLIQSPDLMNRVRGYLSVAANCALVPAAINQSIPLTPFVGEHGPADLAAARVARDRIHDSMSGVIWSSHATETGRLLSSSAVSEVDSTLARAFPQGSPLAEFGRTLSSNAAPLREGQRELQALANRQREAASQLAHEQEILDGILARYSSGCDADAGSSGAGAGEGDAGIAPIDASASMDASCSEPVLSESDRQEFRTHAQSAYEAYQSYRSNSISMDSIRSATQSTQATPEQAPTPAPTPAPVTPTQPRVGAGPRPQDDAVPSPSDQGHQQAPDNGVRSAPVRPRNPNAPRDQVHAAPVRPAQPSRPLAPPRRGRH